MPASSSMAIDLMLQASENKPNRPSGIPATIRADGGRDSPLRPGRYGRGGPERGGRALRKSSPGRHPGNDLSRSIPAAGRVQDQVQATVSQLPLTVNDAVAGYIHYFEGRGRRTLIAGLERAGRYRPMIQRILDEEGLPPEIIHLAQAESGFIPRAVSRKRPRACGSSSPGAATSTGCIRPPIMDERLDPEKRHPRRCPPPSRSLSAIRGLVPGDRGIQLRTRSDRSAVERTGYADFWELRSRGALPLETTNYVPIILAMTIMAKNAPEYGLESLMPDAPARVRHD